MYSEQAGQLWLLLVEKEGIVLNVIGTKSNSADTTYCSFHALYTMGDWRTANRMAYASIARGFLKTGLCS